MNQNEFIEALKKLNIEINDNQLEQLEKYYNLLIEKNKVMNLTAITQKEEVYLKHFYDSLTIVKIIDLNKIETLCDIGTGAGFPGLVIKILFPHLKIILVDSQNKRINFLQEVIENLNLINIEVINKRAEIYAKELREELDVVTSRAVASLNILVEYSIPLLKVKGNFIAMKGNKEEYSEKALIELDCKIKEIKEFILPMENSKRTLIKIEKTKKTALKYPRKYSEMKKNPL